MKNLREEALRSMATLFSELFSRDSLDTSSHMWWDPLAHSFQDATRKFTELYPDAARVESVMFSMLQEILALTSKDCQVAALHGLGHLQQTRTRDVIEAYPSANPPLEREVREYAEAVVTGDIL